MCGGWGGEAGADAGFVVLGRGGGGDGEWGWDVSLLSVMVKARTTGCFHEMGVERGDKWLVF